MYPGGALGENLHHLFLVFSRLGHDVVVFHLRGGQVQLIGGCQLKRRDGFSEAAGPAVEVGHVQFLQAVILEIPLHGVKFGHGVADRGACCKDNATPAGQFIHITALGKHIAGFLGIAGGETCHIPHFCV